MGVIRVNTGRLLGFKRPYMKCPRLGRGVMAKENLKKSINSSNIIKN